MVSVAQALGVGWGGGDALAWKGKDTEVVQEQGRKGGEKKEGAEEIKVFPLLITPTAAQDHLPAECCRAGGWLQTHLSDWGRCQVSSTCGDLTVRPSA